jgi:hypothetical protein
LVRLHCAYVLAGGDIVGNPDTARAEEAQQPGAPLQAGVGDRRCERPELLEFVARREQPSLLVGPAELDR